MSAGHVLFTDFELVHPAEEFNCWEEGRQAYLGYTTWGPSNHIDCVYTESKFWTLRHKHGHTLPLHVCTVYVCMFACFGVYVDIYRALPLCMYVCMVVCMYAQPQFCKSWDNMENKQKENSVHPVLY